MLYAQYPSAKVVSTFVKVMEFNYTRMVYEQLQYSYILDLTYVRCTGVLPDFWGYIPIPYPVILQYQYHNLRMNASFYTSQFIQSSRRSDKQSHWLSVQPTMGCQHQTTECPNRFRTALVAFAVHVATKIGYSFFQKYTI